MALRRLARDLRSLEDAPLPGIAAAPLPDDLQTWHFNLRGPGGELGGLVVHGVLRVPPTYPSRPPQVRLCTPLPHPNVWAARDGGFHVCSDMLDAGSSAPYSGWSSSYCIGSLLLQLQSSLFDPRAAVYDEVPAAAALRLAGAYACACGHRPGCAKPALPTSADLDRVASKKVVARPCVARLLGESSARPKPQTRPAAAQAAGEGAAAAGAGAAAAAGPTTAREEEEDGWREVERRGSRRTPAASAKEAAKDFLVRVLRNPSKLSTTQKRNARRAKRRSSQRSQLAQEAGDEQASTAASTALLDDSGATVVFVLPKLPPERDEEAGSRMQDDSRSETTGLLNKNLMVMEPAAEAKAIFLTQLPFKRSLALFHGGRMANRGASSYTLLRTLRKSLREVLELDAGLSVIVFESVDQDVEFWKIAASQERMQELAHKSDYRMRYSRAAYAAVGMETSMIDGNHVRAYGRYDAAHARDFSQFRSLDTTRIVVAEMLRHVNLNALVDTGVVVRWFPAARYEEMRYVTEHVIGFPFGHSKLCLPRCSDADHMRSYFGEGIALFFNFYSTLIRSMKWPAGLAIVVELLKELRPWGITLTRINTIQAVYGGCVIIWGMWFVTYSKHDVDMAKLRWGTHGTKRVEMQLGSYRPRARRATRLYGVLGKAVTFVFLLIVLMTCTFIALRVSNQTISSVLQTVVTFVFSTVWGKIAKRIVQLENKRTLSSFNQALTLRLGFVKLFIFFIPLFRLAFLAPVSGRQCAGTEVSNTTRAALNVASKYHTNQYPNNLAQLGVSMESPLFLQWIEMQHIDLGRNSIEYFLMMLSGFDMVPKVSDIATSEMDLANSITNVDESLICFRGCYPVKCEIDNVDGQMRLQCFSSCTSKLQSSLKSLYFSHALCTILFILVPILQVRWAALKEIKAGGGTHCKPYSLLQYQEKCHIHAAYQYESWGGSYVEDFLEVVIGFSVLVCFATVSPLMATIGFVFQIVEYRLLAYRMTWVTCRPFPIGAEGLEEWLTILDVVLYLATCLSSLLLLCVVRTGLDRRGAMDKLSAVVMITLGLITVKVLLRVALTEKPKELEDADDQNHDFVEALALLREEQRRKTPADVATGCGGFW